MQIRVSTSDAIPIYQQIVNQVKQLVNAGRVNQGDRLPAVRKLAQELLVNPNTVARAYRELETAGVVESRQGSGVFVSGNGSPLARREKLRILAERIDLLLNEARQLGVDLESVIKLVRQQDKQLDRQIREKSS